MPARRARVAKWRAVMRNEGSGEQCRVQSAAAVSECGDGAGCRVRECGKVANSVFSSFG